MSTHVQGGVGLNLNPLPTTTKSAATHTTRLTHAQAHRFLASFLATADVDAAYRPDSRVTERGVVASVSTTSAAAEAGDGSAANNGSGHGNVDLRLTYLRAILDGIEGRVRGGAIDPFRFGSQNNNNNTTTTTTNRKRKRENDEAEAAEAGYTSDASGWQDPKIVQLAAQDVDDETAEVDEAEGHLAQLKHSDDDDGEEEEEEGQRVTAEVRPQKDAKDKERRKEDKKARKKADKAAREKRRREEKKDS